MPAPVPADADDDELLSVVDVTGRPLRPRGRAEVHRRGLWHEVIHCLVVRTEPPARIVLQRRRTAARSFPGLLDLSATGHLAAGESPWDGRREISEELGIDVAPGDLVYLGVRLLADDGGEGRNRERTHVFLLPDDRPLEAFPLDPAEVGGLVELTVADLLRLAAEPGGGTDPGTDPVTVPCLEIGAQAGARAVAATARPSDLIPAVDGYWTVVAVMADRLVQGLTPLAI